jgi:hypothetical protein
MISFRPKSRLKSTTRRPFARFVFASAIGVAVAVGCVAMPAHAADDDEEELLDTKIFKGILKGLGLRKDEANIDYRERSPLVLPPSQDVKQLPTPESGNAAKVANWPDDPDIKRVRQAKEAERKRKPIEPGVDDKPLRPNEMTTGPAPRGTAGRTAETPGKTVEDSMAPSTNAELGSKGLTSMFGSIWAPKEEYTPFTGEPPRASLTEPPRGYRTPSPSQPYGIGKEKWVAPKVDRNEVVR